MNGKNSWSIAVVASWKEPVAGYTEGIHSINGWSLASGRGVLRSLVCRGDYPCYVVPADIVVNGVILVAYECHKQHQNRYRKNVHTSIYGCVCADKRKQYGFEKFFFLYCVHIDVDVKTIFVLCLSIVKLRRMDMCGGYK